MVMKAKIIKLPVGKQTPSKAGQSQGIDVHFNPQTLKITYSNESKGGNQAGGAAKQHVAQKTSKLSVELLFDTTVQGTDVRIITKQIVALMDVQQKGAGKDAPPSVKFEWGTIHYEGIIDSMQETLDYFSEQGTPLRATVSLGMTGLDKLPPSDGNNPDNNQDAQKNGKPGTIPLQSPPPGQNIASQAGGNGNSSDWKSIAAANNIDDPLHPPTGVLLNMNPGAGLSGSLGLSAGGGVGARLGFSAGLGGGIGFAVGGGLGLSGGLSAGAGLGVSGGIGAGLGVSGGIGASAGLGVSGGFGAGGGGLGISGGAMGASAGFGTATGVSAGTGISAGAGLSFNSGLGASATFGIGGGASAVAGISAGSGVLTAASSGVSGRLTAGAGVSAEAFAGFASEADFNAF